MFTGEKRESNYRGTRHQGKVVSVKSQRMNRLQKMDKRSASKVNVYCGFGNYGVYGGSMLGLTR